MLAKQLQEEQKLKSVLRSEELERKRLVAQEEAKRRIREKHREEASQRRYLAILQLMKDEEAEASTTETEPSDFEILDMDAQDRIYGRIYDQQVRRRQRFERYAAQYDSRTDR